MFHRVLMSLSLVLAAAGLVSANYVLIIANLGESKDSDAPAGGPVGAGGLPPVGTQPMLKSPMGPMGAGRPATGGTLVNEMNADPEAVPLYVVAVVEFQNYFNAQAVRSMEEGKKALQFKHQWGDSYLGKVRNVEAAILKDGGRVIPNVKRRFEARFEPNKSNYTPDQLLEHAEWALAHGLVTPDKSERDRTDKVALIMDKLVEADPKHPAAEAYAKVKADLAQNPPAGNPLNGERRKLVEGFKETSSAHYVLFHDIPSGNAAPEVQSRLLRLENAYRSFYYWFALRGQRLPPPKERLVAFLTTNEKEYDRLYEILTAGQTLAELAGGRRHSDLGSLGPRPFRPVVVSDSFLSRRENILVFSAKRLDDQYDALAKHTAPLWQAGFNRADIFKGLRRGVPKEMHSEPERIVEAMTMGLLLRAMEEDAAEASVSHGASRQLLYACGLLPRTVVVPEWLEFGMASFFETSPGSPWPTIGAANFEYHAPFKAMQRGKKLGRTPLDTLRTVVTDGYFRALATAGEKPAALRKARVTAWSLTYFLAQKKLKELFRFSQELGKMPRDLDLSEEALLGAFARAFDCVDANRQVDNRKLTALANQWLHYLETTPVEPEQVAMQQLIQQKLRDLNAPPPDTKSSQPGAGGFGGAAGGVIPR